MVDAHAGTKGQNLTEQHPFLLQRISEASAIVVSKEMTFDVVVGGTFSSPATHTGFHLKQVGAVIKFLYQILK
jgi:hypothetical protein